jgi:CheY-like chemotaxis protein
MPEKVLIVDDSQTSLFLLQSFFEEELNNAHELLLISDSKEALRILNKETVKLIVLDLMMPGLNGFEFLRKIRQHDPTRHIPVVVLTAVDEKQAEKQAMELGANEYLRKPLDINQLRNKLDPYL